MWLSRVEAASKGAGGSAEQPRAEPARVNPLAARRRRGAATRLASRSRRTARSTSRGLRARAAGLTRRRYTSPRRATAGGLSASRRRSTPTPRRAFTACTRSRSETTAASTSHGSTSATSQRRTTAARTRPNRRPRRCRCSTASRPAKSSSPTRPTGRAPSRNRSIAAEALPMLQDLARGLARRTRLRRLAASAARRLQARRGRVLRRRRRTFEPGGRERRRWELRGCPSPAPRSPRAKANASLVVWFTAGDAGQPGISLRSRATAAAPSRRAAWSRRSACAGRRTPVRRARGRRGLRGRRRRRLGHTLAGASGREEGRVASNNPAQLGAGESPGAAIPTGDSTPLTFRRAASGSRAPTKLPLALDSLSPALAKLPLALASG